MPTITINGKVCDFQGSPTILQTATANGIEIPHYCYHDALSIVASCRICLAEVWAPDPRKDGALEPIPRLLPACQTLCGDGQIIHTDSPRAIANQKAVMEFLLINHPLDCATCDQAGECDLQDYSYRYGRGVSRFQEQKNKQPKKDLGPNVLLYSDRCIMCTRCVRFTREVSGTAELCVVGRGSTEEIDLFPGHALDNELSGNVVDICPVGALLDKDFMFSQRVWYLTRTPSIDGITASGDNIAIQHNEGRIYRITPRTNLEINKWWISDEIRYTWKFVHSDQRLTGPTRAQYGERIVTTFPQAYKVIDEALTGVGSKGGRVAALLSPMLSCEEAYLIADYTRCWHADRAQAILGVGPVPINGQDKTFPPGAAADDANAYTIRAEKAPNARGIRRILSAFNGGAAPLEYQDWLKELKHADAVIVTGNYPSAWITKDLVKALSRKFVILIDTLPGELTAKADVVLPSSTWAEKAGTFENVNGILQTFAQAIQPIEGSRPEGRILQELIAIAEGKPLSQAVPFDAAAVRAMIADELGLAEFADEHLGAVEQDVTAGAVQSDMQLIDL